MHKIIAILAAAMLSTAVHAQDTKAEVKAQGDVERAAIKANEKANRALNKEAEANVKADADADRKKLKANRKAQKEVSEAAEDLSKAQTKAQARVVDQK
ncbi:hypothetical protein ABC383_18225 [Noviherbaspirillum sp. 1P10PC]|uniref:hypothetical protein n=1 Tax=Noviherbaspirillum sp. 1P10PC TaxID=3132292 RepID=UPI0039A1C218